MGMNSTPSSERTHIGFFGLRNAGKSSVVNAVTGQDMSVVSEFKGTTTDPVSKTMELLPLGPVVIIDTPGFDDEGELGEKRVARTKRTLNRTDLAVLIVDAQAGLSASDRQLIQLFTQKQIPYLIVYNKADLTGDVPGQAKGADSICESALTGEGITELKERLAGMRGQVKTQPLVGDLIEPGDTVLLVIPIDKAAPKGRLILPQQMMIRGVLDAGGAVVCVKENLLEQTLQQYRCSRKDGANIGTKDGISLVITDSQVFREVAEILPESVPLTSFSVLMARYKGLLDAAVQGARRIDDLADGDTVLISEGCTHHRQCDDIGTVKIPKWLTARTGAALHFETSSGMGFPEDLRRYALIIHCGGCMLGDREVQYRMKCAADQNVPITNYGTAIAYMNGILDRSTKML